MLEKIIGDSVEIQTNDVVIKGCVVDIDENFLAIAQYDNSYEYTIINIKEILMIRKERCEKRLEKDMDKKIPNDFSIKKEMYHAKEITVENPVRAAVVRGRPNNFSMIVTPDDGPYDIPTLIRETTKGDK